MEVNIFSFFNLEYNDRIGKLRSQESFELEIEDRHFLEYQIAPLKVGYVDELKPEEKFSVDVEYDISTKSDWTSFSIDSEEKWEDQDIEILSGEESLLYPPKINSKEIYLAKKSYDSAHVRIKLNAKMIIPKSKLYQKVVYVIKKGDIAELKRNVPFRLWRILPKGNIFELTKKLKGKIAQEKIFL